MKNTSICLFEKSLVSSANRSRFKLLTCEPKLKTDVDLNKLAWLAPPHLLLIPPFSPSDPQPPCRLGELSDSSGSTTNSSQPPELRHRACFISHPLNWVVKTCKNNDGIGQGRVLFFFFFFFNSPPALSLSLSHESQVGCLSIHLKAVTLYKSERIFTECWPSSAVELVSLMQVCAKLKFTPPTHHQSRGGGRVRSADRCVESVHALSSWATHWTYGYSYRNQDFHKHSRTEHEVNLYAQREKTYWKSHSGQEQINLSYAPSHAVYSLTISALIGIPVAVNLCLTKAVKWRGC